MAKLCSARPGQRATGRPGIRSVQPSPPGQSSCPAPKERGGLHVLRNAGTGPGGNLDRSGPGHGPDGQGTGGNDALSVASADRGTIDRAQAWLRGAMLALAVLAAAAAAVSWDAQYVLVRAVKRSAAIAALEAGIPDVGAVIFAALGIALALHGRHAIRARLLNLACVGASLAMNALASAPGWRDLAIWIMPSAAYALASDTLIGVVRARSVAGARRSSQPLPGDDATPMAIAGGLILWLARLTLAPASTIAGFRRWVLDECPVAPGRKAMRPAISPRRVAAPLPRPADQPRSAPGRAARPGKQARLLALAAQRHDLATIPLKAVSRIATAISAEIGLSPGTARRVLLAHVRSLQNGDHGSHDDNHGTEGTS